MKRVCLIPAVIALLFCLTACGTGTDAPTIRPPAASTAQPVLPVPEQTPAEQAQPTTQPPHTPVQTDHYLSPIDNDQNHTAHPLVSKTPNVPIDGQPTVQPDSYLTQGQTGSGAVYGTTQIPNTPAAEPGQTVSTQPDGYLSGSSTGSDRVYSTTTGGGKDRYHTDPVPVGKPLPTEPQDQQVDTHKQYTCTFSIECATILNNLSQLDSEKLELVPSNGVILPKQTVTFYERESVFDVLQRLCREKGIHLESSWTPLYNTAYIEGIHNLYEFDCGALSGWMYRVNGWYPNYGCSRYQLAQGDVVEWRYTCDLGNDIGGHNRW